VTSHVAVSVVIATYWAGEYLRQAITSALAQSFSDIEVLVCDDASDARVQELVASFRDSRLICQSNPTRLGPARNHWSAFSAARGEFLAILNHDDLWYPDFLTSAVGALTARPEVVLAFCDHDIIDFAGKLLPDAAIRASRQWGREHLTPGLHHPFPGLVVAQTIPVAMGCVFRRSVLDPVRLPDVGPAYDLWLGYELARTGGGAFYLPDRLTAWRVHATQLTQAKDESWTRGMLAAWQAAVADPLFHPYRAHIRGKASVAAASLARMAAARADRRSAWKYLKLAMRYGPFAWRTWASAGVLALPLAIGRRLLYSRAKSGDRGTRS
jgi:glycosyltransferase involved in cell wall biosynthesis